MWRIPHRIGIHIPKKRLKTLVGNALVKHGYLQPPVHGGKNLHDAVEGGVGYDCLARLSRRGESV
jgi:hypothetical protein